jgi:hypothetical protein
MCNVQEKKERWRIRDRVILGKRENVLVKERKVHSDV